MKHYNNSRVNDTIQKHEGIHIREPTYMDAYNKTIKQDGISGCIRCGVDFRNMDFVIIPEQSGGDITLINPTSDGVARCLKANYYKVSLANLLKDSGLGASGVIEISNG